MTEPQTAAAARSDLVAALGAADTLALATISPAGAPVVSRLPYVTDGLRLYCWDAVADPTATNVAGHPVAAFSIEGRAAGGAGTIALEGSGPARVLHAPDEIAHAVARARQRFPALTGEPAAEVAFLLLTPSEIWRVDAAAAGTVTGSAATAQGFQTPVRRVLAYSVHQQTEERVAPGGSALTTVEFPAGAVIVRQGTAADTFYIIVDGAVAVLRDDGGRSEQIDVLRRGQFFGEIGLLRDVPRTATVQALEPATLLALDRAAFRDLLAQSLGAAADFDRIIQERLAEQARGNAEAQT